MVLFEWYIERVGPMGLGLTAIVTPMVGCYLWIRWREAVVRRMRRGEVRRRSQIEAIARRLDRD